jgi:hypothetical protein
VSTRGLSLDLRSLGLSGEVSRSLSLDLREHAQLGPSRDLNTRN